MRFRRIKPSRMKPACGQEGQDLNRAKLETSPRFNFARLEAAGLHTGIETLPEALQQRLVAERKGQQPSCFKDPSQTPLECRIAEPCSSESDTD
jgi:hypothetical protein